MKKRLLSLLLIFTFAFSLTGNFNVSAASMFGDVNGHWGQGTIEELAEKGIINGKGNGMFDPDGQVTRAEFIKLLVCTVESSFTSREGQLADVPKDAWFNPYVYTALDRSLFYLNEIEDNYFLPNESAKRETVVLWAVRLLGIEGDNQTTPFVDSDQIKNKLAVATAYNNGIITGDAGTNTFRPNDGLTRAEAAVIIKKVMAKYVDLHTLRSSKNMVDYKDGINEIEADESTNVLVSVDEKNGLFTFDKISSEISNLKVGDIFLIKPCNAIPTGVAIKVAKIEISGQTAKITQGDIKLEDVIDEIDTASEIVVTSDYIVEGSLGKGVTLAMSDSVNSNYLADAGDVGISISNSSKNGKNTLSFGIDYDVSDDLKISGKFSIKDFKVTPDVSGSSIGDIKIKLTETHEEEVSLEVSGEKKWDYLKTKKTDGYDKSYKNGPWGTTEGQVTPGLKKDRDALKDEIYKLWQSELGKTKGQLKKDKQFKKDIKLASFNIPTPVPGLFVTFDIKFKFDSKLEGTATITNARTITRGFQYTPSSGISKISEVKDTEKSIELAGSFDAKAGASFSGGVTYLYILSVNVSIEGGLGFSAGTEFGASLTKDNTNNVLNLNVDAPFLGSITKEIEKGETRVSEIHTCDICVDMLLYAYLTISVEGKLGYGIFSITLFNPQWEILNKDNCKLATGYLYFNHNADPFLGVGLGQCPNKYSTPVINEIAESKTKQIGEDITLFVRTENNSAKERMKSQGLFTNKTTAVIYQWYKDNIAIQNANSNTYQIASLGENDFGTYKCIVALKEYPIIYVISDDIVIKEELPEEKKVEEKKTETQTTRHSGRVTENNNSTFTFLAPETGKYQFTNTTGKNVLININGSYKLNDGEYELVGGHTYTVSVEWAVEDTDFNIEITGPLYYSGGGGGAGW